MIAAVDYASRYTEAMEVPTHTAVDIARFVSARILLVYGPMRKLVMDGAPERNGVIIRELVKLLQARQATPVPYRPMLLGLLEQFHEVWKAMFSMYVSEGQDDWEQWLSCAVYSYNGATHGMTGLQPNELIMGSRLRSPNELVRASRLT